MKIIIIGKRNQMGTMPVMNIKGMSRIIYKFEWDKDIQSYAYEPKNQREADDIFNTQNRLYKTLRFSVWIGEAEPCPKCEEAAEKAPKKEKKKKARKGIEKLLQAVEAA